MATTSSSPSVDALTHDLGRLRRDLNDAASERTLRRLVESLDRGRRLRLAGALHLLSSSLDGTRVVAP